MPTPARFKGAEHTVTEAIAIMEDTDADCIITGGADSNTGGYEQFDVPDDDWERLSVGSFQRMLNQAPGLNDTDLESHGGGVKRLFSEVDGSTEVDEQFGAVSHSGTGCNIDKASDAIFDATLGATKPPVPSQLWEGGVFGFICGNGELHAWPTLPKLDEPPAPAPLAMGSSTLQRNATVDLQPVFTRAIKLKARWSAGSDDDSRLRVLLRWRAALYHNVNASEVGMGLRDNDECYHVCMLEEIFEGKSTNTLAKRVNSLLNYLNFWRLKDESSENFLPFTSSLVYNYMKHLKSEERFSAIKAFMECLRFCEHVLGLRPVDSLTKPWISGISKAAYAYRKPKVESRTLTVQEIMRLEQFVISEEGHHLDRYACGVFLCMLYGRARASDLRNVSKVMLDFNNNDLRMGYIEIHTIDYKCSRLTRRTGRPFIVLAPAYGLCGDSWGKAFIRAAAAIGVDLVNHVGPMINCPDFTGQLTGRYPTSTEVTAWLNGILDKLIDGRAPGLTSHGLKASLLAWAGKAGLSEYDRHVLGGHTMKGRQVMATYSRDILAAPVRALEEVISSVRHGNFFPDSSRANMFSSVPAEVVESHVSDSVVKVSTPSNAIELPEDQPGEQTEETLDGESGPCDDLEAEDGDSDSDSTSSTSSSEVSDTDADKCMGGCEERPKLQKFEWKPGCTIYKNSKTKKLHLKADGSSSSVFLCGRQQSSDFVPFEGVIATESSKCKQCDVCKPLQNAGAAASHLEQFLSRSR